MFLTFTNEFKTGSENRKWNYPNRRELFLLFPDLRLKNFFYKMFLNFVNEFKAGFENRKWNYPNRKWNYFSKFLTYDSKTSFTESFQLLTMSSKTFFGPNFFQPPKFSDPNFICSKLFSTPKIFQPKKIF